MPHHWAEIAFTKNVRASQEHYGTRENNERLESAPINATTFSFRETAFIAQRDHFYLSTVSETGWPYVQFRGGPPGFVKILDETTLGYADFRGNLQYVSIGNVQHDDRAALIMVDYSNRKRLKIFAHIQVIDAENNPDLIQQLTMPGYKAKIERAVLLKLEAFDWNCPQHITPRFTEDEIADALRPIQEKLAMLEQENKILKSQISNDQT